MPTSDVILGLHLYFSYSYFTKDNFFCYQNSSPTFRRWSTKGPTKDADITREHQMRQVLFPSSGPDTVMSKEVVSIRAIWERISFVGPVPAKHRPPFLLNTRDDISQKEFSTVCQLVVWNQFCLNNNSHFCKTKMITS